MKDISQLVVEKIKGKKMVPKPRWEFLVRNFLSWSLFVLSILFGSLVFSTVVYLLSNNDWEVYGRVSGGFLGMLFLTMPYFWLVFLLLFLLAAYYNIFHTKSGYKYPMMIIVLISIFSSAVLGAFFHHFGSGRMMDEVLAENVPAYEKVFFGHRVMWMQPENGLLAGTVVKMRGNKVFDLVDLNDNPWEVLQDEQVKLFGGVVVDENVRLRLVGTSTRPGQFMVTEIRPWMHAGCLMHMMRGRCRGK